MESGACLGPSCSDFIFVFCEMATMTWWTQAAMWARLAWRSFNKLFDVSHSQALWSGDDWHPFTSHSALRIALRPNFAICKHSNHSYRILIGSNQCFFQWVGRQPGTFLNSPLLSRLCPVFEAWSTFILLHIHLNEVTLSKGIKTLLSFGIANNWSMPDIQKHPFVLEKRKSAS